MRSITLEIDGMSCGHCVSAVQSALKTVPGVTGGTVAVGSADVTIDLANAPADEIAADAVRAIRDAGYEARVAADAARTGQARASRLPVSSCCSPRPA